MTEQKREEKLYLSSLHLLSLCVPFFSHTVLDIGNTPAVALDQGAGAGHWVLHCECLLPLIRLDGSNEEDKFPQGACNISNIT